MRLISLVTIATSLLIASSSPSSVPASTRSFVINGDAFFKDGLPFTILSGEMHSSRSHPDDWPARLDALAALGVNTITTYIVWSHHEPLPSAFDFNSMPLVRWLTAINASGLLAVVRVGPYVTAEFDWGGLPFWLSTIPGLQLRTNTTQWLELVDRYFDKLVPLLLPFQYSAGGPIINMQVEDDTDTEIPAAETEAYYSHLIDGLRTRGVTTLISTLCGFWSEKNPASSCQRAARPGVWVALEFSAGDKDPATVCSDPAFRDYYPKGPCMVMETYTGWIDSVGGTHQCTAAYASWLASLLAANMSVSTYMGFGGTNFGFESGSDLHYDPTELGAIITSYDYNAPVTEDGQTGTMFADLREVYVSAGQHPPPEPANATMSAFGPVNMTQCARLWDAIAQGTGFAANVSLSAPVSMEVLQQAYGWILYEVAVSEGGVTPNAAPGAVLCLPQLQDRAVIYVGGVWAGLLGWSEAGGGSGACITLPAAASYALAILVENVGRCSGEVVDTSCALKGILGGATVTLGGTVVAPPLSSNWTHTLLPMGAGALPWGDISSLAAVLPWITVNTPGPHSCADADVQAGMQGPVFWRGTFTLPSDAPVAAASYLKVTGWGHGFAAVNGFNLGRFSCRGPQEAMYVPAAVLRHSGSPNEVVLFEVDFNAATNCTPAWGGGAAASGGPRSVSLVSSASWTSKGAACP